MGRSIHRNGDRYREWSSICDQYVTEPMTRAEMAEHLAATAGTGFGVGFRTSRERNPVDLAEIEERLARADARGTSAHDDHRDATTWENERCNHCATFHHSYKPDEERPCQGMCLCCGHDESHVAHRPPCRTPATP